jgi:hypothetical protein
VTRARYGWESDFPSFRSATPDRVRERLHAFITDASPEQLRAWRDSIPGLQQEIDEILLTNSLAKHYSAILEYELPMESRRPDALLLVGSGLMVVELKGKSEPSQADIDQTAAYARDLSNYHRECAHRSIVPVLVPTQARGYQRLDETGVHIAGPDAIDELVARITEGDTATPIDRQNFLAESAYCPLPTLVEAARELFRSGSLRRIEKASKATAPAVEAITAIIHLAAATSTRHLILITGVPGAGKTLVGLQTVHAHYLDDLAVDRGTGKPTAPAVFLSGNGPLVEVLQYELKGAGGDGKTFVRDVKNYVRRYTGAKGLVPPEHVMVFDEAQRAWDADRVREKHPTAPAQSEPEHFIAFAERIPGWSVVIGLIGTGQEINVGEEGGLDQWRRAVELSPGAGSWTVHAPPAVAGIFASSSTPLRRDGALSLDTELRFHSARELHRFVGRLLDGDDVGRLAPLVASLESDQYHLRLTRSLDTAKRYLRDRYAADRTARFGMVASSRDRDLVHLGIPNDYPSTQRMRLGPWYGDDEDDYGERSCRRLQDCVTEFGAQGLELDATLLAWGTDLVLSGGRWSIAHARGFKKTAKVKDPFQLRLNAYRVLLTRGRDGCVLFVPRLEIVNETYEYFRSLGIREL